MEVDEAVDFFVSMPDIAHPAQRLRDVADRRRFARPRDRITKEGTIISGAHPEHSAPSVKAIGPSIDGAQTEFSTEMDLKRKSALVK